MAEALPSSLTALTRLQSLFANHVSAFLPLGVVEQTRVHFAPALIALLRVWSCHRGRGVHTA
jgi:hypothetical protein